MLIHCIAIWRFESTVYGMYTTKVLGRVAHTYEADCCIYIALIISSIAMYKMSFNQ